MGIKLNGSSDFDETLFKLSQLKAAEIKAESEGQIIDQFNENNNIELNGENGNYHYSYDKVIIDPTITSELSFSNVSLFRNTTNTIVGPWEKVDEDEDYIYYERETQHIQTLIYKVITSTTVNANIWTNNAKVIYHRKTCSYGIIPEQDYEGATTITILLTYSIIEERQEEKDQPIPVNPSEYGAFPSGIDAKYCVLVCQSNKNFANDKGRNELNEYANDYEDTQNIDYFGRDENEEYKNFIYLTKSSIDPDPEDPAKTNEVIEDFRRLYGDIPFAIENEIENCIIEGQVEAEPCYKVYLAGKCQLIDMDGEGIMGGQQELQQFRIPNGYYILIGKKIYLFLLTDIGNADWEEDATPQEITFASHSTLGSGTQDLFSRTIALQNNKYYIYKGTTLPSPYEVDQNTVIFDDVGNVRHMALSDSIIAVHHLGGSVNPDNGYIFPKHLEYLGPVTISYSASNPVYIYTDNLTEIAEDVFQGTQANLKLWMTDAEELEWLMESDDNKSSKGVTNGYIALSHTVTIGDRAFKGVSPNKVNLTACAVLTHVGQEAFAVGDNCQNFYFRETTVPQYTQLSQRYPHPTGLIWLPDEFVDVDNWTLDADGSYDERGTGRHYNNDTYKTLGQSGSECNIHLRNHAITLNDM